MISISCSVTIHPFSKMKKSCPISNNFIVFSFFFERVFLVCVSPSSPSPIHLQVCCSIETVGAVFLPCQVRRQARRQATFSFRKRSFFSPVHKSPWKIRFLWISVGSDKIEKGTEIGRIFHRIHISGRFAGQLPDCNSKHTGRGERYQQVLDKFKY
jgi:hypothetical protein